jgi:hypothetical protein
VVALRIDSSDGLLFGLLEGTYAIEGDTVDRDRARKGFVKPLREDVEDETVVDRDEKDCC